MKRRLPAVSPKSFPSLLVCLALLLAGCRSLHHVELDPITHRFVVDAKINGQPIKLGLDTGAENLILFRPTAERLKLRITNAPPGSTISEGKVAIGMTEVCRLTIGRLSAKTELGVVDMPRAVPDEEIGGVIGWPQVRHSILQINAAGSRITFLRRVPNEARGWTRVKLRTGDLLILEATTAAGTISINVDTGSDMGVGLSPARWREWTSTHPERPRSLTAYFMPGAGAVIGEETWARDLSLGPITLTDVPIREANSIEAALGSPNFAATLGIAGLKRLNLIVDGEHGVAYVQPLWSPPAPYAHNRAGAAFVPQDLHSATSDFVAHVLEGGPAYEAGIRNGDVVLSVNGQSRSNWTLGPSTVCTLSPPGSRVNFNLKRGTETFETTVVLRDLLPVAK